MVCGKSNRNISFNQFYIFGYFNSLPPFKLLVILLIVNHRSVTQTSMSYPKILLTIYKTFVGLHLDYGDIIYEKAYNSSFHQKIEYVQYKACLSITGAIRGTSKEKPYDELGLESLQLRRWFRKLCYFMLLNESYANFTNMNLLSIFSNEFHFPYTTRNTENIPLFKIKHNFFKNLFFPSAVIEWNSLDHNTRNVRSSSAFKNNILKFIWPTTNSVFNCKNHRGMKLITRLHVQTDYKTACWP